MDADVLTYAANVCHPVLYVLLMFVKWLGSSVTSKMLYDKADALETALIVWNSLNFLSPKWVCAQKKTGTDIFPVVAAYVCTKRGHFNTN